jgi:hypothetical protein
MRAFLALILLCAMGWTAAASEPPAIQFERKEDRLVIRAGDKPLAEFVLGDDKVQRPYFARVHTPSGIQATRNHPPKEGEDPTDHDTMHPGLWLAFGDLSGADFWRNKAGGVKTTISGEPRGEAGRGSFSINNDYFAAVAKEDDDPLCEETANFTIFVRPPGYLLRWESTFTGEREFTFGDQEEMGLGVRLASPLRVTGGNGRILDSEGRRNEKEVWGKQADWCDYRGEIEGRQVGIAVFPSPRNFRRSWFHARDYGYFATNPFGRNAFTGGEKSAVSVKPGEEFRLAYGVFIYDAAKDETVDLPAVYDEYVKLDGDKKSGQ